MSSEDACPAHDAETQSLLSRVTQIVKAAGNNKAALVAGAGTGNSHNSDSSLDSSSAVPEPLHAVYPRRFWVLFLLSVVAMQQTSLWMSYSPVQQVVQRVYGWDGHTINLLVAWGPLVALPMVTLTPILVARLGLRAAVTLCAALGCACALLRCVTTQAPYALYLAHFGQILNAAAGPIATCVPSLLSAQWFEPDYRTTATAISTMAENLGAVAGFIAGLYVKNEADFGSYVVLEAGIAIVILLLCIGDHFFPALPLLPPSASSAAANKEEEALGERSLRSTFSEMWQLCGNKNFMLLSLMYAISVGTATAWGGVVDPILAPLGYSQDETGMIGLVALLSGMVGGVVFAALADRIHAVKKLLCFLFVVGIASFGWLAILCSSKVHGDGLYLGVLTSSAVGMFAIIGATALFYEEGVEAVFPIGALAANAVLGMGYAVLMALFFLCNSIIPPALMCWLLPIGSLVALISLSSFQETHSRRSLDGGAAAAEAPAV